MLMDRGIAHAWMWRGNDGETVTTHAAWDLSWARGCAPFVHRQRRDVRCPIAQDDPGRPSTAVSDSKENR
jgi:hypothetical protein